MKTRYTFLLVFGIIVILIIIAAILILVKIPYTGYSIYTEKEPYIKTETYWDKSPTTNDECSDRDYNAKGGYINDDGTKYEWNYLYTLFDSNGEPDTTSVSKYYINNYESQNGKFIVRINFDDANGKVIETYDYKSVLVGARDSINGYISYNTLWQNKPGKATSFFVTLVVPKIRECQTITRYEDTQKTREVTDYIDVQKVKEVTKYCNVWKDILGKCKEDYPDVQQARIYPSTPAATA